MYVQQLVIHTLMFIMELEKANQRIGLLTHYKRQLVELSKRLNYQVEKSGDGNAVVSN